MTPETYSNFREAYAPLINAVLSRGEEASPRGLRTRELLGASFRIMDPTDTLAAGVGRKLNVSFAAADALQVVGGFTDHRWAAQWNPRIAEFGEHGAYGPRIGSQVGAALQRLVLDTDSRRAVVQIWNQARDLHHAEGRTDFPCTTLFQLMVRHGALDIHVHMRANDLWWGTPYDVFTFAQVQLSAARVLGIPPGVYHHHATSLHLYEKDWEAAEAVFAGSGEPKHRPAGIGDMEAAGDPVGGWERVMDRARAIAYDAEVPSPTASEEWYLGRLARPRAAA